MEQDRLMKIGEERFTELGDKVSAMSARTEDLLFRAQRWANAIKNRTSFKDTLFADDLSLLRRTARTFMQESSSLTGLIEWIEREAHYDENPRMLDKARSLLKMATGFEKELGALNEQLRHLHHFIPLTELKVEAWYMVQDIEVLHDKVKGYPFLISSKVMNVIAGKEKPAQPGGPAP